jgi:hypothetical protein
MVKTNIRNQKYISIACHSCTVDPQKKKPRAKTKDWSHRESNTGRSRIFAGLTKPDEPQATVIPLHYRTDDKFVEFGIYVPRHKICSRSFHMVSSVNHPRSHQTNLCFSRRKVGDRDRRIGVMEKEQSRNLISTTMPLSSRLTRQILDQDTITYSIGMTNGKAVGQD